MLVNFYIKQDNKKIDKKNKLRNKLMIIKTTSMKCLQAMLLKENNLYIIYFYVAGHFR